MLLRLRRALIIAAEARNLAVDLMKEHGVGALAFIERSLAAPEIDPDEREILVKARRVVQKLYDVAA